MQPTSFYHIYNRGNNKQRIFLNRENYLFFLRKVRTHFLNHVDVLAYCLMPNHFHFLVFTKHNFDSTGFSNDLKIMLRSYTRAINIQEIRTGSLFQQNTKIKNLETDDSTDYSFICFHYIHQNPVRGGLADNMEDYEMSSFQDYAGFRNGTICNKELAKEFLDIDIVPKIFLKDSYSLNEEVRKEITQFQ